MATETLLYDGDCGFCTSSARWLRRRIGSADTVEVRPWRPDDEATYGITPAMADAEIHFVTEHGEVLGGADAVLGWWRTGTDSYPLLAQLLALPGLIQLTRAGYRLIAANRHRLPGSTDACRTS
ncbi:thiol-disulfide oxidoreductase DCC family protein [Propionibacteriaceae bacterium Y2011]